MPSHIRSFSQLLRRFRRNRGGSAVVEFALRCYRFVVLDAPRADACCDDTLDLASSIVVVATQELAAIRSAGRTAAALRTLVATAADLEGAKVTLEFRDEQGPSRA